MKTVLASQSQRRRQLLSWLLDAFEVEHSQIDEDKFISLARTPEELVVKLASMKAKKVADQLSNDHVIIGADTIVVIAHDSSWKVIGKPRTKEEARFILQQLRNRDHQVFTGMCVINNKTQLIQTVFTITEVHFGDFSDEVLDAYVESGEPMDKAGAYGIQDIEKKFMIQFKGSFTNIVGLPLKELARILIETKVELRADWQERIKKETGYED